MRQLFAFFTCLFFFSLVTEVAEAQRKPRVRILGDAYRINAISLERNFEYSSQAISGFVSSGQERIETTTLARATRNFSGFDAFFSGNASGSYSLNGEDYHEHCDENFAVESFGSFADIYFQALNRRRVEVSATFGTDPFHPGYEDSYHALCSDSPVGIRGYLMKSIVTGASDDICNGEMCINVARRRLKRNRIRLNFTRSEIVGEYGDDAVRTTALKIRLRKIQPRR